MSVAEAGVQTLERAPSPVRWPAAHRGDSPGATPAHDVSVADEPDVTRRLQTLAFELSVAEARERQRIAQVLHDEVGQLLAMAQFRLSELAQTFIADPDQSARFDEARAALRQAARATRSATFELHSPVLQQLGLQAAIEGLVERARRPGQLQVHLSSDLPESPPLPLGDAVLSVLFRIVREVMLNAQKHAGAAHLAVSLGCEQGLLRIRVSDDGVGFDVPAATRQFSPEGGFGLISAEAQMQGIGGRLQIDSSPGRGTVVTLTLPLASSDTAAADATSSIHS